jgi:hypothetical protein
MAANTSFIAIDAATMPPKKLTTQNKRAAAGGSKENSASFIKRNIAPREEANITHRTTIPAPMTDV